MNASADLRTSSHDDVSTITDPRPTDVLMGRGNGISTWRGNMLFRQIVWDHRSEYRTAGRLRKAQIAEKIVRAIAELSPPGRFVEILPNNGGYRLIDAKRAVEKASQALREKKIKKPPSVDLRFDEYDYLQPPRQSLSEDVYMSRSTFNIVNPSSDQIRTSTDWTIISRVKKQTKADGDKKCFNEEIINSDTPNGQMYLVNTVNQEPVVDCSIKTSNITPDSQLNVTKIDTGMLNNDARKIKRRLEFRKSNSCLDSPSQTLKQNDATLEYDCSGMKIKFALVQPCNTLDISMSMSDCAFHDDKYIRKAIRKAANLLQASMDDSSLLTMIDDRMQARTWNSTGSVNIIDNVDYASEMRSNTIVIDGNRFTTESNHRISNEIPNTAFLPENDHPLLRISDSTSSACTNVYEKEYDTISLLGETVDAALMAIDDIGMEWV